MLFAVAEQHVAEAQRFVRAIARVQEVFAKRAKTPEINLSRR
jgi:hypothetical protein